MLSKNEQRDLDYYAFKLEQPAWKSVLVNGLAWAVPVMIILIPVSLSFIRRAGLLRFQDCYNASVFGLWEDLYMAG